MTWSAARSQLIDILAAVADLDAVLAAPPQSGLALTEGVTAFLSPPARTSVRRAGCATERTYRQQVTVVAMLGDDPVSSTVAVDDAIEAIDAEMESHVTLDGMATSCRPFAWDAAVAVDYPPQAGVWFVSVTGTVPIILNIDVDRRP